VAIEPIAEAAAERQIVGNGIPERGHDAPPSGHGRASSRSARRSTLA
jgi:hypothetical protein